MLKKIALVVLVVSLAGCYQVGIETGKPRGASHEMRAHMFLYGLTGSTVNAPCDDIARVETERGFVDLLLFFLTSGLYSPASVTVTCAAAPPATAGR